MPERDLKRKKPLPTRRLFGWLLRYAKSYRAFYVLLFGLTIAEIFAGLIAPWSMKILVDNVLGNQPAPSWLTAAINSFSLNDKFLLLIAVCLAGFLIGALNQILALSRTQLQVSIGQRMVFDLQQDLFEHLQKLSLRYHQQTGTGDAIYRLNSDAYCVSNIIMSGLFPLFSSVLTLFLMFTVLLWLEWSLALLSLIVVPPLFFVIHRYWVPLSERNEKVKEMEGRIFNLVHEVFSSIKLVKAFSREQYEKERFTGQGSQTLQARLRITLQESIFSFAVAALTLAGTAAVLAVGGWHVLRGALTVGELLVVVAYLAAVYGPLSAISHTIGSSQGSVASARRVYQTLQIEPETESVKRSVKISKLKGHIKFEDVSFAYTGERPILRNINLEAKPGEMMAIVGLTGAGKSTLVSLIPRFYDAAHGRVTIDGIDVREIPLKRLRESISIVTQEPILFSSSIADNIRYGKLNASQDEIAAAAQAAQAQGFIEQTPDGYETRLGDSGSQLSGGERQRISIARALLKDAPILILDEPTSALDSRSESQIFTALRRLMKNRTTIVIAHRLSTIRDADKIIVLDGGRIAAEGKHELLLRENELYRELYERLLRGFGLETNELEAGREFLLAAEAN